ncbi:hypothetical protein NQ317_000559 [Molorchus minor]|uniref:Uncharacterized protein n=1 Tax=Molorchus minor TaxID=1323400 RepID=A0ABQ9IQB7_9CUCU|nr:hypothetical protein NQ317_000559 [Molorchus minor]
MGKRLRWTTPEREVLSHNVKRHSNEGTNPSIEECSLLIEQNSHILNHRNAHSILIFEGTYCCNNMLPRMLETETVIYTIMEDL